MRGSMCECMCVCIGVCVCMCVCVCVCVCVCACWARGLQGSREHTGKNKIGVESSRVIRILKITVHALSGFNTKNVNTYTTT
jgi:hypothetical protein